MKAKFHLIFAPLILLSSLIGQAQIIRVTESETDAKSNTTNFIGAELPVDTKYYHKTAEGIDSVILAGFTIYGNGKKRVYTVENSTPVKGVNAPYFKGVLNNGQMQEGELYYEDNYYSTKIHYKGTFRNNKADGIGILTLTELSINAHSKSCKANFENGYLTGRGMLKLDYDSAGVPNLYYSGDLKMGDGFMIFFNGFGSFFRMDYCKPTRNRLYGTGVANAYYEGQMASGTCTGYGVYNHYDYNNLKTSNFKVGLLAADYPAVQFSTLPIGMETPGKTETKHEGLNRLLPKIDKAGSASFIYNGRSYTGMQFEKKPYGFGIMEDSDGFYEIGFWKNGSRIPTYDLLSNLLPDSSVLKPQTVINKISRNITRYNSKKNKYYTEEETLTATITYYGHVNTNGKIEGWGWRMGTVETEVGYFIPFTPESNKKAKAPAANEIFSQCYAVTYGDGSEKGYIVEKNRYRFYTNRIYNFHASQVVPNAEIPLNTRDINTIALTEYRDKRNFEVDSYKGYISRRIEEMKKKDEEKQRAFDALFLKLNNPTASQINECVGNFYLDKTGSFLYKILKVDAMKSFQAQRMATFSISSSFTTISASELLSSGYYRKVQNYITCRSCGGTGKITNSYSYTGDYEYTYGAKITTTTTKTGNCKCGCGLEPAQFGAKIDW